MEEENRKIFNQTESINNLFVNSNEAYKHELTKDNTTNKKIENNIYYKDTSCDKLCCREEYNGDGLVVKREFYNEEGGICYTEIFEHDKIETGKFVSTLYSGEGPNEYCDNVIGYRFYKDGCGSDLKSGNYFTLVSPELKFNEDKKRVECADSEGFAILEGDITPGECYTILTELFKTDLQSKEYGNQITGTHIKTLAFFYLKKIMLQEDKDIDIYFKSFITDRNRGEVDLDCKTITNDCGDENKPKFIIRPINVNGHATVVLIDGSNDKPYIFDSSLTHLEKYTSIFTSCSNLGNLNDVKNIDELDGEKELQVNGCCSYWAMFFAEVIIAKIKSDKRCDIDDIIKYTKSGAMCLDITCKMSELFDNPKEKPTIQKIELNDSVGDDYIKLCVSDNDCYKLNKDAYKNKFLNLGGISKFVNNEEAKKELDKLIAKQEIVKKDNRSLKNENVKLYSINNLATKIKEKMDFNMSDDIFKNTLSKVKKVWQEYSEQYRIMMQKIVNSLRAEKIYKTDESNEYIWVDDEWKMPTQEEWNAINKYIEWNDGAGVMVWGVVQQDESVDDIIKQCDSEKVKKYVTALKDADIVKQNLINSCKLFCLISEKDISKINTQIDFLDYFNEVKSFICYNNIDKFFDENNVLDSKIEEQINELFKCQEEIIGCISNKQETIQNIGSIDSQERYSKEEFLLPQESIVPNIKETLDGISPDIIERVKLVQKEFMDKVKIRCGVSKFDGMKMN